MQKAEGPAPQKAEGPNAGSRHVESFLEMLAAERGAAANTRQAYERDLNDFGTFLEARGKAIDRARVEDLRAYLGLSCKALRCSWSSVP